ncbi:E3 ubiquitin-protein ligase arih2 [Ciborinia camelliae]|nr:E3 ubiquitin-protein ligase arih2 [Ciborinia camelliae]
MESPLSGSASPILSNSPPPEYLSEADLLEFPLLRATNLHSDEGYELQTRATDIEESLDLSKLYGSLNEEEAIRRGYFFDRDNYSSPSPGLSGTKQEKFQMGATDVEKSPGRSSLSDTYVDNGKLIPIPEIVKYGHSSPSRSLDGAEEEEDLDDDHLQIGDDQKQSFFSRCSNNDSPPLEIKCTICQESHSHQRVVNLSCGCMYCSVCLQRRFIRAIEAEYMFPAKCCDYAIDVTLVRHFLTLDILRDYEAKAIEYGATERVYCANRICSEFIAKENIQGDKAFCTNSPCDTVTCVKCKGEWHERDCPVDEALQLVLAEAKKHAWKRCEKCGTLIEHADGCAHMKCPCGHQFCYCCTAVWGTCHCRQDELNQTLGITPHRRPDYVPQFQRPDFRHAEIAETRNMIEIQQQREGRLRRVGNQSMNTSGSNASPGTSGLFERFEQDYAPAWNTVRPFGEYWDTPAPPIDEYNQTIHASTPNIIQTVRNRASIPQDAALAVNNTITGGYDQTDRQTTGLWSNKQLDGETGDSSETLGANFEDHMHEIRVGLQNLGVEVGNCNEIFNTPADNGLDAETRLSITLAHNGDDADIYATIPTSTNIPSSHLNFENEIDKRPLGDRSTPLIASPTHGQDLGTAADGYTPAQLTDSRRMRRQRAADRLKSAWEMHGYMPNLHGYREYFSRELR